MAGGGDAGATLVPSITGHVEGDRFNESAVLALLRDAGHGGRSEELLPRLIAQVLVATDSDAVRDAAALALADLDARQEIAALIRVLERPELAKRSGTLLFALDELGGSLPLAVLVHLIEQGPYAGRAEALIFARHGRVSTPSNVEEYAALKQRLAALKETTEIETAEAAAIALAHLT